MSKDLTPTKILIAARKAKEPYRFGDKVLLVRVASLLGTTVGELRPLLLLWHRDGRVQLARIDLVQAFDSTKGALRRSEIHGAGGATYHAVVV